MHTVITHASWESWWSQISLDILIIIIGLQVEKFSVFYNFYKLTCRPQDAKFFQHTRIAYYFFCVIVLEMLHYICMVADISCTCCISCTSVVYVVEECTHKKTIKYKKYTCTFMFKHLQKSLIIQRHSLRKYILHRLFSPHVRTSC